MRAYHRIDPLMDERKGHYTPAQLGAWIKVQLVAGRQTKRGWFRSVSALRSILPATYVRHVDFLILEGDLELTEDGRVYVHRWDDWQEGDLTVKERMARLRNKHRNPTVTHGVSEPSPTAIRSSVGSSVGIDGAIAPVVAREPIDRICDIWMSVRYRIPTDRQRAFLYAYLQTFDETGEARAERLILSNPHDPIAAMKADLAEFRGERVKALEAEEQKPRAARKGSGLTGVTAELAALYRDLESKRGDAA